MKTKITLAGIAISLLASLPLLATNTEDLILSDGVGDSITINQSGAVSASSGTFTVISATGGGGDITFLGTLGKFSFDLDSGQAGAGVVSPTLMNTTTINTLSTGAGTLSVTFSDTGYTTMGPTLIESASDTYTADTPDGSNATFKGYNNAGNFLNSTSNLIGTVLSSTDTSFPASQSDAHTQGYANTAGTSGSLTEVITLAFTGAGTIDTGFTISNVAVPEPASIVFLGSVLLALAAFLRKKLAKQS
jgi:hypothetical protein